MYRNTIINFADIAGKKTELLKQSPMAFVVGALMAGAYVGTGIILIFSIAGTIDPAWQKLVMGASFGVALSLVVFAGAELFTGHTMYMVFGRLCGTTSFSDLLKIWLTSWWCNFIGSVLLALVFYAGGGGAVLNEGANLLFKVASYKMNAPALELLARGALCNWLVCLALWIAARTNNDAAKAIMIFWCLFAFIASGYEHSVANMTLLSIALLADHPETIHVTGMAHNLLWVTAGNIIGGSVFMGLGYWLASGKPQQQGVTDVSKEPEAYRAT